MASLRILVVDDNQDSAKSLADIFEDFGHQVTLAFDGESAIERFQTEQFDLTFLDVRLPGMSGVESFFAIQQLNPGAKVVMMTGYGAEPLIQQAIDRGALAALTKPLDMERVLGMLEEIQPECIILLAEDDPDLAESLQELLMGHGYTVMLAGDGEETVQQVLANPIQILILDMVLPVFNGLEVYMRLRQHGRVVPTILITGYAVEEAEAIQELLSYPISSYLTKPIDPSELLSVLQTVQTTGQ